MQRIRLVYHEACSTVDSLNVLYNVHVFFLLNCRYMHGCLFVHLSVQYVP